MEQFLISQIPGFIRDIAKSLHDNGFECYLVGGSVRDSFFGVVPKDFDLATNAMPEQVLNILKTNNISCEPRGVEFGVVVASNGKIEVEIATFRSDISSGTGNLMDDNVLLGVTIEEDVKRRDFTINALFFDLNTNKVIDLVNGLDDLKNGVIRCVGNADDRFNEDSTRKLRAIRFATRLGFELDHAIKESIQNNNELLCNNERIEAELVKIFSYGNEKNKLASKMLIDFGFDNIFGGVENTFNEAVSLLEFLSFMNDNGPIKSTDLINGSKLLKQLRNKEINKLSALRLFKSTTLSFSDFNSETDYSFINELIDGTIAKIVKNLNKEALELGLSGKLIGEYVAKNI